MSALCRLPDDARIDLLADEGVDDDRDPVGRTWPKKVARTVPMSGVARGDSTSMTANWDTTLTSVMRPPGAFAIHSWAVSEIRSVHTAMRVVATVFAASGTRTSTIPAARAVFERLRVRL